MTDLITLQTRLAALNADYAAEEKAIQYSRKYDYLVNEGAGGYSSHEDASRALYSRYMPQIMAVEKEIFRLEWTPEVTAARRELWNSEIEGLIAKLGKKFKDNDVKALANRLGFKFSALQEAVALYKDKDKETEG